MPAGSRCRRGRVAPPCGARRAVPWSGGSHWVTLAAGPACPLRLAEGCGSMGAAALSLFLGSRCMCGPGAARARRRCGLQQIGGRGPGAWRRTSLPRRWHGMQQLCKAGHFASPKGGGWRRIWRRRQASGSCGDDDACGCQENVPVRSRHGSSAVGLGAARTSSSSLRAAVQWACAERPGNAGANP